MVNLKCKISRKKYIQLIKKDFVLFSQHVSPSRYVYEKHYSGLWIPSNLWKDVEAILKEENIKYSLIVDRI